LRFILFILKIGIKYNLIIMIVGLIGGFLISLVCLRQTDLKSLIAYSSIAHIRLVLRGVFTYKILGFSGSISLIIGHGLCSSGIFCLANINYERSGSRVIYLNKGLINFIPGLLFIRYLYFVFVALLRLWRRLYFPLKVAISLPSHKRSLPFSSSHRIDYF